MSIQRDHTPEAGPDDASTDRPGQSPTDSRSQRPGQSPTATCAAGWIGAAIIVGAALAAELPRWAATFTPTSVVFADPDDYMRVYRARRMIETGEWRIKWMSEINYPRGAEMHWTAPMDWLITVSARLFGTIARHPDPVGCVAAVVPPICGAIYLFWMIGLIRRGFGWAPALLAGAMVALSPAFHRAFQLGHPDHQALLELFFLIGLTAILPMRAKDGVLREPCRASVIIGGVAIGMALWVGPQAMLAWGAILLGLTVGTYSRNADVAGRWTDLRRRWNVAVAIVVVVGFLVENLPKLLVAAVDKISLVQVAMVAVAFLVPTGNAARRTRNTGAALCGLAGVAAAGGLSLLSPLRYVRSPEFVRWSREIAELQPLVTVTPHDWSLHHMHADVGFLPYAIPILLVMFLLSPRLPRPMKTTCGLLAATIAALTILQLRWLDHFNFAVVPVAVIGLFEGLRGLAPEFAGRKPSWAAGVVAIVLALLIWPAAVNVCSRRSAGEIASRSPFRRAAFAAARILEYEQAHPSPASRRAILSDEGDGPTLLYYTGLPVVSTPYHRALEGLIAAATFFAETDATAARSQLDALGVRYIVIPPSATEQLMYDERIAFGELRSFDPPMETIDVSGRVRLTLRYRPAIAETMIYRLQLAPVVDSRDPAEPLPGVRLLVKIRENPSNPDMLTGLVFVVGDGPS